MSRPLLTAGMARSDGSGRVASGRSDPAVVLVRVLVLVGPVLAEPVAVASAVVELGVVVPVGFIVVPFVAGNPRWSRVT